MMLEQVVKVPRERAHELFAILNREEAVEGVKSIHAFEIFTAGFENGIEVDIRVCNGNPPFVDAVMFKDGSEVLVLEPRQTILGQYLFEYQENEYLVYVEVDLNSSETQKPNRNTACDEIGIGIMSTDEQDRLKKCFLSELKDLMTKYQVHHFRGEFFNERNFSFSKFSLEGVGAHYYELDYVEPEKSK